MQLIIDFGEGTAHIPFGIFEGFEALEFLDNEKFERRAEVGKKFKSNIAVGKRAAIKTKFCANTNCTSGNNPISYSKCKGCCAGISSNSFKSEVVKILCV